MSLKPGGKVFGSYSLDDAALVDSMALAIEEEFALVYQGTKGTLLPDTARKDMRLLFVGVARGVLRFLSTHEGVGSVATVTGTTTLDPRAVHFNVDLG